MIGIMKKMFLIKRKMNNKKYNEKQENIYRNIIRWCK